MTDYGAKILNIAKKSLSTQQAIIANISNNISNVNTPGYSRRVVNLQTATGSRNNSGIDVGNGVDIASITRMADEYLNQVLRTGTGTQASSDLQSDFLNRVDKLFPLDGSSSTISNNLTAFFGSMNDLSADPSNIQLRAVTVQKAQDLVTALSTTYSAIANLQDEADSRIATEVQSINNLTTQIAELNTTVSSIEQGGNASASDARDQRDKLLQDLSGKITFRTIEQSDGQINIYLSNGFSLVAGSKSYDLSVTANPSFASGTLPPSLSGKVLSYVTYDYSGGAGTGDFDLSQVIQQGEGTLGALLKIRGYNDPANTSAFEADGPLVEVASRIEGITRSLLTDFNTTYLGADENPGTAVWDPSSIDLNGAAPTSPYGFFDFQFAGTKDADGNGLPDDLAGLGIDNFSSLLQLTSTDPRKIAAARDQNAAAGAVTFVTGDGSNAQALANLKTSTLTFSAGSYTLTGTYDDVYNELIQHVSGAVSSMSNRAALDKANLATAESQRDQVSSVSLDEEFTQLITHQQAYQASAKLIKTADDLLSIVISLLG